MPEGSVDSNTKMMKKMNLGASSSSSASNGNKASLSMQDLLSKDVITPNDVKRLNSITEGEFTKGVASTNSCGLHRCPVSEYLCKPGANEFKIDFTKFKIRDMESGRVLFEIAKPEEDGAW